VCKRRVKKTTWPLLARGGGTPVERGSPRGPEKGGTKIWEGAEPLSWYGKERRRGKETYLPKKGGEGAGIPQICQNDKRRERKNVYYCGSAPKEGKKKKGASHK